MWSKHATEDFQKRGGDYPKSGVPDMIEVSARSVYMEFKNTSEADARNWVVAYAKQHGLFADNLRTAQIGDYRDDWVEVFIDLS